MFRPELVPEIIKGLIGGFATGIITLLTLLQAKVPTEIAYLGSIASLVLIFLWYYLPDRKRNKEENSLPTQENLIPTEEQGG